MGFGGLDGGEAEGEAFEVIFGGVGGFSFFLDGAEEFAHGAVESVGEPFALEFWGGDAVLGIEFDLHRGAGGGVGGSGSESSGDIDAVLAAEAGVGVEGEGGLGVVVFDEGLSEECLFGELLWGVSEGGVDAFGHLAAHEAGEDIEPVDGEVIEDDMSDGVELSSFDPVVIPVYGEVSALDFSEEAMGDGITDVGEIRGPSAVLIDGEFDALFFSEVNEFLAGVEVEDEGFL